MDVEKRTRKERDAIKRAAKFSIIQHSSERRELLRK